MSFNSLDHGDWQNFIYLGLVLTVLVGSLLSRRDLPFSKIFKYLAIWAAVAIAAIIVYSYRFEFSDVKSRFLREINPSAVQVNAEGELVISLSQDGHFYMDLKINGVPMRFMVDTGASDIVISIKDAKRLGIDPTKLTFNRSYQTANGISWGAYVNLSEIEIGNAKFHNVGASVNNADMGTPLLGMSFLRQFEKYEFYRDKLVLKI